MDLGVILGLVVAVAAILGSNAIEGGDLKALTNPSAAMLVIGGTLGATLVSHGLQDFLSIPRLLGQALKRPPGDIPEALEHMVRMAQKARREGLLALEEELQGITDPFLAKGIQMVVDGADPELVRGVLETDLGLWERRQLTAAAVFETAGGYAPTMGIIGTVMGLVHVLANLSDAGKLGPAISVAFLATFYGIASANVIWLPIGTKLKGLASETMVLREMQLEGILSIQQGDNPNVVRDKLVVFLTPQDVRRSDSEGRQNASAAGEELG